MTDLSDLEREVARLEAVVKPIVYQPPISSNEEFWDLIAAGPPQVPAEVIAEALPVLRALLTSYEHGDDADRDVIRTMLRRYSSFPWAGRLPWEPTAENLRLRVIYMSARDGGLDWRDALVSLDRLCAEAIAAGVDMGPILREVAEISSDDERRRLLSRMPKRD